MLLNKRIMIKKRKIIFLVSLVLIVLFITSCAPQGYNPEVKETYFIGTQGLVMRFMNNAPPYKVYVGDKLDITVELWNRGAWPDSDSFEGFLVISGFDLSAINGAWESGNIIPATLQGKSQFNPEGGYAAMSYKDLDGVIVPFDADRYPTEILVTACYRYKTFARPRVCIDPDPYSIVAEDKVCHVDDEGEIAIGAGSQGAPIAVTSVKQEVGADKIYYRIYITNVGGGRVIEPNAYNFCPFDLENDEINKVYATVSLPHDSNPICTPRGDPSDPIRLQDGRGYMFCSFTLPSSGSAYWSQLHVILDYVYSQSVKTRLDVVNLR